MEASSQQLPKECLQTKSTSNNDHGETQHPNISASSPTPAPAPSISKISDPSLRRILESARRLPADVHAIASNRQPIQEWTDKQPGPMKTIHLTHLPPNHLLNLARNTFQYLLLGNISQQTVGSLLLLAYNIMGEEGEYLTSEPCEDLIDITSRITIQDLSDSTARRGSGETLTEIQEILDENENKKLCIAYTYLAASYMKLFAKSAEYYLKIDKYLKTMFLNFYSFEFPLENFHPDLNTIDFIRRQLQHQEIYKNTFYVFLYSSCENTKGDDLKDFLYRDHVSYAGLHPVSLFLRVMKSFNTDYETLLRIMYSEGFSVELHGILEVFNKLVKRKGGNELQMWRFARVVDGGFLSVLRTKNCVLFTLVLAYILEKGDPDRSKGVLEISQIKKADKSDKDVASAYASRVFDLLIDLVVFPFLVSVRLEERWP